MTLSTTASLRTNHAPRVRHKTPLIANAGSSRRLQITVRVRHGGPIHQSQNTAKHNRGEGGAGVSFSYETGAEHNARRVEYCEFA